MLIKGLTEQQLHEAATKAQVRISNQGSWGHGTYGHSTGLARRGNFLRLVIRPFPKPDRKTRAPWLRQAISYSMGLQVKRRSVAAVCWHGHREFMRECFKLNPDAQIKTAKANYKGSEDFERTHEETGYVNIGSQMYPVAFMDACYCEEE